MTIKIELLFHNECSRNHAAYICNQMFLDLVQFGHRKWDTISRIMPMALTSIVSGARFLNDGLFARYMPFHYQYKGPSEKATAKKLFNAQAYLIHRWCKEFLPAEGRDINIYFYAKLYSSIKQRWYLDIGDLATQPKVFHVIKQGQFKQLKKPPLKLDLPRGSPSP